MDKDEVRAAELYERSCRGGATRACLEVERVSRPQLDDDIILGRWSNDGIKGGFIEIVSNPDGDGYRIEQSSPESPTAVPGETTGELGVTEGGEYDYEGRHIWGGSRTGETTWGRDGGLVIQMLDADTFFNAFPRLQVRGWLGLGQASLAPYAVVVFLRVKVSSRALSLQSLRHRAFARSGSRRYATAQKVTNTADGREYRTRYPNSQLATLSTAILQSLSVPPL